MALFRYKAVLETGKKMRGVIDADSMAFAKEKLRRQRYLVTYLKEMKKHEKEIRLSPAILLSFTRELAQLLKAGLPLYESLLTIEEKQRKNKTHPLFLDLCDKLRAGISLSETLSHYEKTFDPIYLSMVRSAEQSGALAETFSQLTDLIGKQQKLKKQILSSITYPALLGSFAIAVIYGLLFFVIPTLSELFEGKSLHAMTKVVVATSIWFNAHPYFVSIGPIFFALAIIFLIQKNQTRTLLEKLCLHIPFIKVVVTQSVLLRFCRALSSLLEGGVPLLEALRLARKVMRHHVFEAIIERSEKKIVEGRKLSEELRQEPYIPPLMYRMLAIAEETGQMSAMVLSVALIFDDELERNLSQLNTFLQPMLLLLLGTVIGVVLLSVLLPLTDVSSFLSTT